MLGLPALPFTAVWPWAGNLTSPRLTSPAVGWSSRHAPHLLVVRMREAGGLGLKGSAHAHLLSLHKSWGEGRGAFGASLCQVGRGRNGAIQRAVWHSRTSRALG